MLRAESWAALSAAVCVAGLQEAQEPDLDEQPDLAPGAAPPSPEQQPHPASAAHAGGRGAVSGGEPGACASPAMSALAARLRTSAAFQQRLLALLSTKGGHAEGSGAHNA